MASRRRNAPLPPAPSRSNEEPPPAPLAYLATSASETAVDALIDEPTKWQRTESGSVYYGDPEGTFVSLGDPRLPAAVNAEQAWNLVLEVGGDEAAQTLLYVMARCLSTDSPLEKTRIHVNDSLSFRGLRRHKKGDFRPEQKRAEARRFRLLSDIWVTARDDVDVTSGRGGKKRKRINVTSRLIEVAVESEEFLRSQRSGGEIPLPAIISSDGNDVPYAVRVALGDWSRPYLETSDRVQKMLHKIVQYDVSTEMQRFAMRFSLSILFRRISETVTVGELLESARISPPSSHTDRFKENVEEALERLRRDGLIGGWRYDKDDDLPRTRWMAQWLKWVIVFEAIPAALVGARA
jgi:hypothetical protein